jgi:predicted TIM-barrel fold metal-dependent hydrolase
MLEEDVDRRGCRPRFIQGQVLVDGADGPPLVAFVLMTRAKTSARSSAAEIRAGLGHPVVDADGHWQEAIPVFVDYLRDEGGSAAVAALKALTGGFYARWYEATPSERQERRIPRAPWWPEPADTLDRATSLLPSLLAERLDELGIDVALLYPSLGLFGLHIDDDDFRQAFGRAANRMARDAFAPYHDRIIPVAVVPHRTPGQAIEALEDAIDLGFRAIFTTGAVRRTSRTGSSYIDFLGLDSPFDYDPFWRRCQELGVAVTAHGGSLGWPDRSAPTNSVFNHIGHFANASHGFCKALVLGGVPGRFPQLRFGFLEGGVAWACQLHADVVGHWDKRNRDAVKANLQPSNLDLVRLRGLFEQHGGTLLGARFDEFLGSPSSTRPFTDLTELTESELDLDEFASAAVNGPADLNEWFGQRFFYGCESDDKLAAWAFARSAGTRLRAMWGSDIGHFDVVDMRQVLPEAFELVEDGLLSSEDFEDFVYRNAVRLHTTGNPAFFAGTRIEKNVAELLAGPIGD